MNTEQLAKELNVSEFSVERLAYILDGVGFTEDQIVAIIKAIWVSH